MTTKATTQPPVAWRYCGNQLKRWRTLAGVTREQLGSEANYEYDTIKAMELGRRRPTHSILEVADEMCGARGLLLAAEAYLEPQKFATYSHEYMTYEAVAIALNWYEPRYIPGLLQTEEYVRALLTSNLPPLVDETIEEMTAGRLERQTALRDQSKSFSFVIEESVLRCPFSDRPAYERQLSHLRSLGQQRHITLQVMPSARGLHPGVSGPFVLLETPEHEHLAYEEGQTTGLLYSEPENVSIVTRRHDAITRQALCPGDTARFIDRLLEEQ